MHTWIRHNDVDQQLQRVYIYTSDLCAISPMLHMPHDCESPINFLVIPCKIDNLGFSPAVVHVEGPTRSNQPTLASSEESLEFGDCDPSEPSSIQPFE